MCPEATLAKKTLEMVSQNEILRKAQLQKIKPGVFVFGETQGATSTTPADFTFSTYLRSFKSSFDDGAKNSQQRTSSPKSSCTPDPCSSSLMSDWCISKSPINKSGYGMFSFVNKESRSYTPQPFIVSKIAPS